MTEARQEATGEHGVPAWARALEWIPVAWLALGSVACSLLVTTPLEVDRSSLPLGQAAERLALPLLCLTGAAAIIRYFSFRKGQPRLSPAASGEGQDNV